MGAQDKGAHRPGNALRVRFLVVEDFLELMQRFVADAVLAAEEQRGVIRWLRPEFQHPSERRAPAQVEIEVETEEVAAAAGNAAKLAWPKELPEQVRRVADVLAAAHSPLAAR